MQSREKLEMVRAKLVIDISTEISAHKDNDEYTVRFLVEEDLGDLGYEVYSCEVMDSKELGEENEL